MIEPDVRADGLCAGCGKPRKPVNNPYSGDLGFRDPFCSSLCCRTWYGVGSGTTVNTMDWKPTPKLGQNLCIECRVPIGEASRHCRSCAVKEQRKAAAA